MEPAKITLSICYPKKMAESESNEGQYTALNNIRGVRRYTYKFTARNLEEVPII